MLHFVLLLVLRELNCTCPSYLAFLFLSYGPGHGVALDREIGGAARFRESLMVIVNTEPCGCRIDSLSDSHDPAERAVRRERVPSGEGHPLVHQFYSIGAPSVLHRHV